MTTFSANYLPSSQNDSAILAQAIFIPRGYVRFGRPPLALLVDLMGNSGKGGNGK